MKQNTNEGLIKNNCKGSTSIIIICSTLITILLAALLTDIVFAAIEKYTLTNNSKLVAKTGAGAILRSRDEAIAVMKADAVKRVNDLNNFDITISSDNSEITVKMGRPFEYLFLKFIGFGKKEITANVTAMISGVSSFKGSRPFAIGSQKLIYYKKYTLNYSKKMDTSKAGFVPLSLGGNGDIGINILYGYRKTIKVGDEVHSVDNTPVVIENLDKLILKSGGSSTKKDKGYSMNNPIEIVIPVVDKLEIDGRKGMKVLGFTTFSIENMRATGENIEISGEFLKRIIEVDSYGGSIDFGLNGIRIIQ